MATAFRDLFRLFVPVSGVKEKYGFAFLVHPRNRFDITRKYPLVRFLPKKLVDLFTRLLWPIVLSKIDGLKDLKTGIPIPGWVISVPLTAQQMTANRTLALKRIIQSGRLAQNMGAKIVGLGALTSSFSRGGLDLVEHLDIGVTTGHAFTSYTITNYIDSVQQALGVDKHYLRIAIVGASGSIGSTCAQILVRNGYKNFILIDVDRKINKLSKLKKQMKDTNSLAQIIISSDLGKCKEANFILTATNAPGTIVKNEHVLPGTIIFDDAQPSDISAEVIARNDVLVLEAGVISIPFIKNNFNFGLKLETDNFSCLGEIVILAAQRWNGHYVLDRATLKKVEETGKLGEQLGISISRFQNRRELIQESKINNVKELAVKRLNGFQS